MEALKGEETVSELASRLSVHPTTINQWDRALLDGATGYCQTNANSELDSEPSMENLNHRSIQINSF